MYLEMNVQTANDEVYIISATSKIQYNFNAFFTWSIPEHHHHDECQYQCTKHVDDI